MLLADDDELFREGHAKYLRQQGFTCLCAADANEARKILESEPVEVLLADIHMPGNASLEFAGEVHRLAPGLPVILLTGRPEIQTAARSVRLAVAAYLTKPLDLPELLSLVRESVASFRRLRAVRESRAHLQTWAAELAPIEASLDAAPAAIPGDIGQDYLRVALRNLIVQLADLDRSIAAWSRYDATAEDLRQLDLVAAIQRAVEVLEKSRQNFKSKELGELRKQLQGLIGGVNTPPAGAASAKPPKRPSKPH